MKKLEFMSELLGRVIDPTECLGWIIEFRDDGSWHEVLDVGHADGLFSVGWGESVRWDDCRPVYPCRSWAGKTEAELWGVAWGIGEQAHTIASIPTRKGNIEISVSMNGNIGIEVTDGFTTMYVGSCDADAIDTLILALQNAMVLSKRLREAQQ